MKPYIDYIGGEICIGYTIGKGADGSRELERQHSAEAIFGNNDVRIALNLSDFRDSSGRTIGDLLAEHGCDVFKIMDTQE